MKINKGIISKFNPCEDRFNNFVNNYPEFNGNLEDFLSLDNISYHDKIWVTIRLFTKEQNVKFAIKCGLSELPLFESKYPEDKRPRQALEAAEKWLLEPTEENRQAAAASAVSAAASAYAAYAAVSAAAYAAAAASASAVSASAYTASAASAAKEQEELNLIFLFESSK